MHPLLKDATEEQRAVIQHQDGPAVVSATPGSGKCLSKRSLIPTNRGLIQIQHIPGHFLVEPDGTCVAGITGGNENLDQFGAHQTSHWFDMGVSPTLRIETDAGYMVKGTHEHPIVVLDQAGDLQFKCLRDIVIGDVACIARNTDLWGDYTIDLDLAYVLGMLVGDGMLTGPGHYVGLVRDHEGMETVFRQTMARVFDVTKIGTRKRKKGKKGKKETVHSFHNAIAKRKLIALDLPMVRSPLRYVPETVMMGTREVVVSFLQGLFDTEASVGPQNWEYTTASVRLAREVQALLLNLGIRVSFTKKPVKAYPDNDYFRLQTSGESIRRYADVGLFRCHEEKMARLAKVVAKPHNPNKDLVLRQKDRIRRLRDRYLNKLPGWQGKKGGIIEEDGSVFRLSRFVTGQRNPSHNAVDRILKHVPEDDPDAKHLRMLSREFILEPIIKVEDGGQQHVYDFTVPKSHSFIGNGFINHNTRSVTYRIAYLLDHGVQPGNIIGITFTNKAANEMKERVKELAAAHQGHRVWLSTFHSFCNRLMRANPVLYGVQKNFGIADDTDSKQFMTLAMAKVEGVEAKAIKAHSGAGDVNHVRRWVSAKKDLVLTPADVDAQSATGTKDKFAQFAPYYREYQRLLRQNNLLDFDDMIMRVVWKLRRNPEEQARFAEHVHYLMVDEYQDTNYAQFELVRLISHMRKNVLTVLDEDQCFPGDVEVATPAGPRRIDSLRDGDEIICGAGYGTTTTQAIEKVVSRPYSGEVITVKTKSGLVVRATPEHCFFGRLPNGRVVETHTAAPAVKFNLFGACAERGNVFATSAYGHTWSLDSPDLMVAGSAASHDVALKAAQQTAMQHQVQLEQSAYMTDEGKYQYMPIGNLFPGCRVPVLQDGVVLDNEVVSIQREQYSGVVYDLSIPEYRNYCAGGVVVHNSIYGWRGADSANLKRFYKTFPDTATYMLQTNFRSVPGIAAVANKVIVNNTRMHPKEIVTHKQGGPDPMAIAAENPEKEAMLVMNSIKGMIQSGKNDWTWKDFACIYRIRSISRALEDAAVRLNIPYRVVGALNFYNRASTKDILAYCRLIQYPHDDSAFTRIYNKPARGIGPSNFNWFVGQASMHDYSLMKTLRKGLYKETARGGALSGFRKLKRLYRDIRRNGHDRAAPVIERIIMNSGYMFYAENIRDPGRSDRMVEDLHELVAAAEVYDEEHKGKKKHGINGFLEHVALVQLGGKNSKEDNDVVTLMTAHASKGLEFPCVFVCSAVDGVMPLGPRSEDGAVMTPAAVQEHYEEERRVFYVAVTRAEERLVITYPMIRRFGPRVVNTEISRFCTEAGDTLELTSMVDENKTVQMSVGRQNISGRRRMDRIKDGGVEDVLLQRERKRRGTATQGDLRAIKKENDRRRKASAGEPE